MDTSFSSNSQHGLVKEEHTLSLNNLVVEYIDDDLKSRESDHAYNSQEQVQVHFGHTLDDQRVYVGINDQLGFNNVANTNLNSATIANTHTPGVKWYDRILLCLMNWRLLSIILLTLLELVAILLPLTLDGYISKIIPDIVIGLLFFGYMVVIYNNYINVGSREAVTLRVIRYLELDINNPSKRKILFLLNIAISMTPGYVLFHGYVTSGPPAFFPTSLFPILLIIATTLLVLRDGFLKDYIYFQIVMWFFIIDMIISSQIPSRPESQIIPIIRGIYSIIMLCVALFILMQFMLKVQTQLRAIIFVIILLVIVSSQTLTLTYQGGWIWKNYITPSFEIFPHDVLIGPNPGIYLPIINNKEYRYQLLSIGSTPYRVTLDLNTTKCDNFIPGIDGITLDALWVTNQYCNPVEVALIAQDINYDAVIFSQLHNTQNYSSMIIESSLHIPIFTIYRKPSYQQPSFLKLGTSFNDLHQSVNSYTVITRLQNDLWSYPSSYLIQCLPIIIGGGIILFITIYKYITTL